MGEEFVNGYAKGYKEGWDKAEKLIGDELEFLIGLTKYRSFSPIVCEKSAIGNKIRARIILLNNALATDSAVGSKS